MMRVKRSYLPCRHTGRHVDQHAYRQTHGQAVRQVGRRAGRWMNRAILSVVTLKSAPPLRNNCDSVASIVRVHMRRSGGPNCFIISCCTQLPHHQQLLHPHRENSLCANS